MMANPATPQASTAPTTAAQVLDAPVNLPAKTQAAGASDPLAGKTAAPDPAAAKPGEEKLSPKLQLLIQRERAAVDRERSATTKEAQIKAREDTLAAREAKITEFESIKQTNPRKALELLGLSYQELTQAELNDGAITPDVQIKQLEDKFNAFSKSQEDAKRQSEEDGQKQQAKQSESTIAKFKGEISSYIKENSNRYELIQFEENESLVYDVIDEHYNRTLQAAVKKAEDNGEDTDDIRGEVMTIVQAADKVEEHLEKKYVKARDLSKVKALLAPRPTAPTVAKPQMQVRQMPKTLNNQISATQAPKRTRPETDDERIARAIAYARGLRPTA